ncbi:MAG: hypothetical protein IJN53_07985 [Oscillospiraceae bacterium]|nr:hypothetical protein [Oscillospiraceae bacterium]
MPSFDNRRAAAVWQRVHAAPQAPENDAGRILELIPPLVSCAQLCAGNPALQSPLRTQANALRGMYALLTGESPAPAAAGKAPPLNAAALRKCYAVQLQALGQYQALCGREDFGPAFQALIPMAQSTLAMILSQLGAAQKERK